MNKKDLALMTLLVAIVLGSVFSVNQQNKASTQFGENLKEYGLVIIYKNGVEVARTHNLITNIGMEQLKLATNGTSGNWNFTNLTVGGNTSALAATDTQLANIYSTNGLSPAACTYARQGTGNSSCSYQWTVTTAASAVNSTGIYNSTLGILFAEAAWTPSTTLQIGDKLNVTYYWGLS